MNAYVLAGYVVVLATLAVYSVSLLARERAARLRLGAKGQTRADHDDGPTRPERPARRRER